MKKPDPRLLEGRARTNWERQQVQASRDGDPQFEIIGWWTNKGVRQSMTRGFWKFLHKRWDKAYPDFQTPAQRAEIVAQYRQWVCLARAAELSGDALLLKAIADDVRQELAELPDPIPPSGFRDMDHLSYHDSLTAEEIRARLRNDLDVRGWDEALEAEA